MATLILARHGRTEANATGILAGRSPGIHLDEHGIAQADKARERLDGVTLASVVTSPMERCRETAKRMVPGQRAAVDKGLNECDYGDWTGQPLKTLAKEKLWRVVQSQPAHATFPGGESLPQMAARAIHAVRRRDALVSAEHGPDAVWLAVSHGDIIKAILADALGMHLDAFQRILVSPASLSVIRYNEDRPYVVTTNSTSGSIATLLPQPKRATRRRSNDAVVGGGA